MAENKFSVKLDVNNIGPHYGDNRLLFSDEVDSNKAIIYATNGTGKSFISRALRLTSFEKHSAPADELLTLGESAGSISFEILNGGREKKLSVSVEKGKQPTISDSTRLLFHVFNSDYVEENIKPRHFSPNGDIEGYILGKAQIDLTEEKRKESGQKKDIEKIGKVIDNAIDEAKTQLRGKGVQPTTKELSLIDKARLRNPENIDEVESFEVIVGQLEALTKVPEKIDDVGIPMFSADTSVFSGIERLLLTEYPSTEWDESFVSDLKAHRSFIERGLEQIGRDEDQTCPFCKQALGNNALDLIRNYRGYLSDKEAETLRRIESYIKSIDLILASFKQTLASTNSSALALAKLKKYFPSLVGVDLRDLSDNEDLVSCFVSIRDLLEAKSDNLSRVYPEITDEITMCKKTISLIERRIRENTDLIKRVNVTKNNAAGERLLLRRSLCRAQYKRYCELLAPMFSGQQEKADELKRLQDSIAKKEQKMRISKKEKVCKTLDALLNHFFSGKYSIDKESFQIRFLGHNLGNKASNILSDGEKSIVAFCYYLASTHLLVEREDDYNKLFFIIDDPVSSMDFHYVYAVAQSLRDIKGYFEITSYDRMWVFTHNIEFLSIMSRNHIISRAYIMKPGGIEPIKHQLLMPYASHLKDIIDIASGNEQPSHTTANSIRHVLETVSRFEYPQIGIEKYITEDAILSKDSCVFTLCQDLSHGGFRNQPPFSTEVLISACKTVFAFMSMRYEGQVKAIPGK